MSRSTPLTDFSSPNTTAIHRSAPARLDLICRGLLLMLCLAVSAASSSRAQSLTFSGPVPVGSSSQPLTLGISIARAGSLSSIAVEGQGASGVDFIAANAGTCTVGQSYTVGSVCTVAVSFLPSFPGTRVGAVQLLARDGSVLGAQYLSGVGSAGLGVFLPGTISTVVGHSSWIYSGDGVVGPNASIFLPFGVAVDTSGDIFIADSGNNRIRMLSAKTGLISTIAGTGNIGGSGDGGPAIQGLLSGPSSVALDGVGNVYLCDSGNNVIRKITMSTGIITTVAGQMGLSGYKGDLGLATTALLNTPNGISLDIAGNIFIADTANNVIRRVDAVTNIISTVAGNGTPAFNGDGGAAIKASLNAPWSALPTASGALYIADQGNNRIRMVNSAGVISTIAGTNSPGFSGDLGPATKGQLNVPAGIVLDVAGNIYIADSGNNRVRKINATTGIISTIAGTNSQSISGDGSPANAAGLYGPYTLALDGLGNLYIADVFHNRIRKITASAASLSYQPIRIGRISAPQQQLVENDGNVPLNVSSLLATSGSVIDGVATTCLSGTVLTATQSCVVSAAFAPTSIGTPVTGVVTFMSDAIDNPGILQLTGNVLSVDPATVTLVANANPVTVGNLIIFSVTVSSDGSIPTGTVTLLDGTTALSTATLQTGGVASFNISSLTGGQHSITASYDGDTNNTPATSPVLVETVQQIVADTVTSLVSSAASASAGTGITLTANVAVKTAGTATGTIAGTVTFNDGPTILGAATVASGVATLTTTSLTVGQHSLVATYSGSTSFAPSTSATVLVGVQADTTTTLLASSANPSFGGQDVTLTASLLGQVTVPTGTVTFLDGVTPLATALITQTGVASLLIPGASLTLGTHDILAVYGGDASNTGSSSLTLAQVVLIAPTTVAVTSSLNPSFQGSPVTLTAVVTSGGGIPSGTVEFFNQAISLGKATLDPTGTATLSVATLPLGLDSITCTYAGDALDDVSTSPALIENIQPATSTVTILSSSNPAPFGTPLAFTIMVHGTGPQPIGTVILQDGTTLLGSQPIDQTGTALFANINLSIGTHNLTALYSGDADHAPVLAALTQQVLQVSSTSLSSSITVGVVGLPITFTAYALGISGQPLTGIIQFKDGPALLASVPIDATGAASLSMSSLSIGLHNLTAVYMGDAFNEPSVSNLLVELIQIATTSTTLASTANPSFTGAALALQAVVATNGATPTGSVTFKDGTSTLGTVPLAPTGTATLTTSVLAPGNHSITATYGGDANSAVSSSLVLTQQIIQQTTVSITSSANPSMFQDNVAIQVTVSGGLAGNIATGSVALLDGGSPVGTATLNGTGAANFTLTAPPLGIHTLTAIYAGDTRNSPATSTVFAQNVILRPTTTALTTSSTAISAGQDVTFVAIVQSAAPLTPTGVITFLTGSTVLGTAPLNSAGIAILTFTPQQAIDTVVAHYPGDTLFAASVSPASTVVVGPTVEFTINMTPPTLNIQSGSHTTLQVSIVSAPTFKDTLSFGCAGLPAYATCTFSQSQVQTVGGTTQTLTVVVDTGTPLGAGPTALNSAPNTLAPVYACMLPFGSLLGLLWHKRCSLGRRGLTIALVALLSTTSLLFSGCGTNLNVEKTSPGAYTFRIIGTGATTGATQSGTVSMTVTQ